ncbi:hypothetical protein BP5796_03661 [Coleophoma crateriformis]|uniref:ML-like domain-containing protein n=1 Tax=Coleophoma crateriformis TaxID=565419 RepID=A0A3D8SNU3_9HELO|nr:hypothetical protein BP5796_03661 [Coleophoma crateriformis]
MRTPRWLLYTAAFQRLILEVYATDVLKLSSFSECVENPDIFIDRANIEYDSKTREIQLDIAGRSSKSENVTASLHVAAYGKQLYTNNFNPCDRESYVAQLCPVPVGNFAAATTQTIPTEYADRIPSIAYSIPDIALQATIELKSLDDGRNVGCISADLSNGKSINSRAVTYVAAGIAAATLLITGLASFASGGGGGEPGKAGPSPNFMDIMSWFQTVATTGMLSVNYPPLYRSFTEKFAFSTGLISWTKMQSSIDSFRSRTGGNITTANIIYLKNATLVFSGNNDSTDDVHISRSLLSTLKVVRDFSFGDAGNGTAGSITSGITRRVSGIKAYAEGAGIVQQNTFMTAFLVACVVSAAIAVGILLLKAILESWALCGKIPKSLVGFRKHYWGTTFRSITNLIYIFYGPWVGWSIFQFKTGDSWAATLLAAATLILFSSILICFAVVIIRTAQRYIKSQGSAAALFEEKRTWLKYSLFYNTYRKNYWWFFNVIIAYSFIRGFLLAALNGKGFAQTIAMLVIEALMLIITVLVRPHERKIENIVNITTRFCQTLTFAGVLIFVNELKVQKSTQTIMGFALVIFSVVTTAILVILLITSAFITCCANNPHRQRRKEAEKRKRESDALISRSHYSSSYTNSDSMIYTRAIKIDPATEPLYTQHHV